MAVWMGKPYHEVLRDVIVRALMIGPKTLEDISIGTVLNGENPEVSRLQAQAIYLEINGTIFSRGNKYVLTPEPVFA